MSLINDALKRAGRNQPTPENAPGAQPPPLQPADSKPGVALWIPVAVLVGLVGLFAVGGWLIFKALHSVASQPVAARRVTPSPAKAASGTEKTPSTTAPAETKATARVPHQTVRRAQSLSAASAPSPAPAAGAGHEVDRAEVDPSPQVQAPSSRSSLGELPAAEILKARSVFEKVRQQHRQAMRRTADTSRSRPSPAVASTPPPAPPAPVAEAPTSFPPLKLQGIFYRPSKPSALINRQTVFVGEHVDGAEVVAIAPQRVTVRWRGQTRVLTLP